MKKTPKPGLPANQEKFVLNLVAGMSQRAAYREAYPRCKATDGIVDRKASKLYAKVEVRARFEELMGEVMRPLEERTIVTARRVREELAKVAFANGTDFAYITADGHVAVVPTGDLPEEKRGAVAGIRETRDGVEVKTHDKVRALELLGRDLGMFDGKGGQQAAPQNNLLETIAASTGEEVETDDLPEVQ